MPRTRNRLTHAQVKNVKLPLGPSAKLHSDGGGLYLRVAPTGNKSWIFQYRRPGQKNPVQAGLGAYPEVSLAEARDRADEYRKAHSSGTDPVLAKQTEKQRQQGIPTFEELAADYIREVLQHARKPVSNSSLTEWNATLRLHVFPALGNVRVDRIDPKMIAKALRQVWGENKSASRILNRVERILSRAVALGYRRDNPATWEIQQHLLGRTDDTEAHHDALPWRLLPEFMAKLRDQDDEVAKALEFTILTVVRVGNVVGNKDNPPIAWDHVDLPTRLWKIPGNEIKGKVRHYVPLSDRALELLPEVGGEPIFLVKGAAALLVRAKEIAAAVGYDGEITAHGFRSTFKDWGEENGVESRLSSICLAHKLRDVVEAAYNRTNRIPERIPLMQRWADFCDGAGNVVELRRIAT